jgi:tight adherence protein B
MLLAILVFLLGAGAVFGGYWAVTYLPGMLEQRRMAKRLQDVSARFDSSPAENLALISKPLEGPLPAVDRMLSGSVAGSRLARLIEQSGVGTTPSAIVLMSFALAGGAALAVNLFVRVPYLPSFAGIAAAVAPTAFLLQRRSARMRRFEEQFPEALDLMARGLRAGHAFQSAMGMVADELKAPVGPEFKKTFDQQNFGLPLRDSLNQLSERVPHLDVRFFVTAVLIQRETGGNLAEILDNLGHVVRERFKILRQVRTHTAHGRFTAFVLLSLPAALALILTFISPDHMYPLFNEPIGQKLILGTIVMETIGFFWIKKIIKIEV